MKAYIEDITEEMESRNGEYCGEWYSVIHGMDIYRVELNDEAIVYDEEMKECDEDTRARVMTMLEKEQK